MAIAWVLANTGRISHQPSKMVSLSLYLYVSKENGWKRIGGRRQCKKGVEEEGCVIGEEREEVIERERERR